MAGGTWDPSALPTRAGVYANFVTAAAAQIQGGARGIVAIPIKAFSGGTAAVKTFYSVTSEKQAITLFGSANVASVVRALKGGAKEVLVWTLPAITGGVTEAVAYAEARSKFEARSFNVFAYDGIVSSVEQTAGLAWMKTNRDAGNHFLIVFGCVSTDDDADPALGNTRSALLLDKYSINLINGVIEGGVTVSSAAYAPYVAGLVAGQALNKSTTYAPIPVDDVTRRMTNTEIKTALAAGSFVLVNDGEKVKVERGITTDKSKIRKVRAEQAIITDITKTGSDSYIGKLNNNADGQAALISAISKYLEDLAASNVLVADSISVGLDPNFESVGDQVFLAIGFVEVDSMEEIFLTINVGGAN
jgi:hypothetical protein